MKSVKVPNATKSSANRCRAEAKSTARTCSASSRNHALTASRSSGAACGRGMGWCLGHFVARMSVATCGGSRGRIPGCLLAHQGYVSDLRRSGSACDDLLVQLLVDDLHGAVDLVIGDAELV